MSRRATNKRTAHAMTRPPVAQRDLSSKKDPQRFGLGRGKKPSRPLSPTEMARLEAAAVRRDGRCVMAEHVHSFCDGKSDPHHIVPQRTLLNEFDGGHAVFKDLRNIVAVCRHHHNQIERAHIYLPDEALPEGFDAFLLQYGLQTDWDAMLARRIA